MAALPIQSGVEIRDGAFVPAHPVNLRHRVIETGVAKGELIAAPGAVEVSTGPGIDRGGIAWRDQHYRVMGVMLVRVAADGAITEIGEVGGDATPCRFAYGFDRLAIASGDRLFHYDVSAITEVTDTDLGLVRDLTWIDSYFVTTDGESVLVADLNNPASVNPLRYGSAEKDPDAVTGLDTLKEELVVFGTNSVQFFQNVGGTGFPFQNVPGAMVPVGCVGPLAKCKVAGTLAFVGSGKEEPLGVYVIAGGGYQRVSDEAVDRALADCGDVTAIELEARRLGDEQQLVVHCGAVSYCVSFAASQQASSGLWHRLNTNGRPYRLRHAVFCHGVHWVGDSQSARIGRLDERVTAHFGEEPGWSLFAGLLYNEGRGFIVHEAEIAGMFPQSEHAIFFAMTRDGELWSREVARRMHGDRQERAVWRPNVRCARLIGYRWRGYGKVAVSRCDTQAEPLAV